MKNKVILFTEKDKAELIEEDIPNLGKNDVLVKLAISAVSSGTERANLSGEEAVTIFDKKVPFPRRCGYSSAGIVEKIGENVSGIAPGDRVALSWSTHSQYCRINQDNVHKILDPKISFEEAALWHISTFPTAAIRKCHLEMGESAIVMGQGILGMMAIKLLSAAGAAPIIAADPIEEKRKKALEIGADYAFNPFDNDFIDKVKSVSDGGVNVAIEVTGNGQALDTTLDCMSQMGRVALLGCTRNSDFKIDYYKKVHGRGVSLIGAHTLARPEKESSPGLWTTHDDVMAVQKLVMHNRLSLRSLTDEIHSPIDAPRSIKDLSKKKHFPLWNLIGGNYEKNKNCTDRNKRLQPRFRYYFGIKKSR